MQTSCAPNFLLSMDSKQAFLGQSSRDESKKDMEQTKFLTACHIICVFIGSRSSSQVETMNLSMTNGGGKC